MMMMMKNKHLLLLLLFTFVLLPIGRKNNSFKTSVSLCMQNPAQSLYSDRSCAQKRMKRVAGYCYVDVTEFHTSAAACGQVGRMTDVIRNPVIHPLL